MKKIIFVISLISVKLMHAQVGIGTDEPKASLDINGNLKIELVEDATTPAFPLYRDEKDHKIKVGSSSDTSGGEGANVFQPSEDYALSKMTYKLYTGNQNAENIIDYNTKIPTSKFRPLIIAANLRYDNAQTGEAEVPLIPKARDGQNSIKYLKLEEKGGTWHIKADFTAVDITEDRKWYWEIITLVINKGQNAFDELDTFIN
ncbi:hypothetical protein ACT4R9_04755 [Ornithobacterium rhinotracheale]|uniref:hypothetical protein n=1 Tax=Ornithobacterium rhinotracheale TaxID=28251 RepID=UPI003FA4CE6E